MARVAFRAQDLYERASPALVYEIGNYCDNAYRKPWMLLDLLRQGRLDELADSMTLLELAAQALRKPPDQCAQEWDYLFDDEYHILSFFDHLETTFMDMGNGWNAI